MIGIDCWAPIFSHLGHDGKGKRPYEFDIIDFRRRCFQIPSQFVGRLLDC